MIRSMLVDTGASGSLNFMDIEENLSGAVDSEYTTAVANNSRTRRSLDGNLKRICGWKTQRPCSQHRWS